jgi:hypothetical protein
MSKPLPGDNIVGRFDLVPGKGSSTGNVTGGRKFARYTCHTSERGAPFTTAGFARVLERVGKVAKLVFKAHPHMLRHAIADARQKWGPLSTASIAPC